jgi:ribosome-binding factor A
METTRQQKINRLIQKDLGEIFQKESHTRFSGRLITVTSVKVSPDLGTARVHVSFFPNDQKDEFLVQLTENTKFVRHELARRIKNQLRTVPELSFLIDDSLDYIEKIENLLKK